MSKRWIAGALTALTLWPATAPAAGSTGIYAQVLNAYRTSGSVPACRFTSQQLSSALGSVDTYGQQYFADFIAAINAAMAARAAGGCSKHHITVGSGGSISGGPQLPGSVTASTSSGVPAPLIVLGIAAAVLAIAAALAVVFGGSPALAEWRHSWAEARYRLGGRRDSPRRG